MARISMQMDTAWSRKIGSINWFVSIVVFVTALSA
jgi:hypothetical protein